jgi:hypothetical protein
MMSTSTRWNPYSKTVEDRPRYKKPDGSEVPVTENIKIRHTTTEEARHTLGLVVNSDYDKYLNYSTAGLIEHERGNQIISAGEYFNEFSDGSYTITKEPLFQADERRKTLRIGKTGLLTSMQIVEILDLIRTGSENEVRVYLAGLTKD